MKIIVDSNIIFSSLLNNQNKIADLIINSDKKLQFIAPNFLRNEINTHRNKLIKISKLPIDNLLELEHLIFSKIHFISEEQINSNNWKKAYDLTKDVDVKDTVFIAYTMHFKCKLWTGDKKLINGLSKKGFVNFISTNEIYELRNSKSKK